MEPSPAVLWRQAPAEDKAVREAEFSSGADGTHT